VCVPRRREIVIAPAVVGLRTGLLVDPTNSGWRSLSAHSLGVATSCLIVTKCFALSGVICSHLLRVECLAASM